MILRVDGGNQARSEDPKRAMILPAKHHGDHPPKHRDDYVMTLHKLQRPMTRPLSDLWDPLTSCTSKRDLLVKNSHSSSIIACIVTRDSAFLAA